MLQRSNERVSRKVVFRRKLLVGMGMLLWFWALGVPDWCSAALQFDVFLGYDGIVPEASWFPVTFEARNDGPTFTARVEVRKSGFSSGQSEQMVVELPTGTLKRFSIPVFSDSRSYDSYDVRVWDQNGKLRSEQIGLRPRRHAMAGTPILGSLSRTPSGTPEIAKILSQQSDLQPCSARLLPPVFPDNPLVLEGLDCLYLNSERATDLNPAQGKAITDWLEAGGRLVVAVEQPGDINAVSWLKRILPIELREVQTVEVGSELDQWLRDGEWLGKPTSVIKIGPGGYNPGGRRKSPSSGRSDRRTLEDLLSHSDLASASVQVAGGDVKAGEVNVRANDVPLVVSATRGHGSVTVLLFSPEREPIRSWKHLPVLWAKLAGVPREWYESSDFSRAGGYSSDSIFGAMIDSRQVHKLPLQWLLLLLLTYLVVIGPLDYYWLKRLRRPMLTWITFPLYVVAFSGLIYLIGYKLRAGESEWNELHVVDVYPKGQRADLRGRTYASVYAPANATYALDGPQRRATFRGEFSSVYGGGQGIERVSVLQLGDTFKAQVSVPVWTSQLLVSDWVDSGQTPVELQVTPGRDGWQVEVENRTSQKFSDTRLVVGDRLVALGTVASHEKRSFQISQGEGIRLKDFVEPKFSTFQMAVQYRGQAFAHGYSSRLDDLTNSLVAVSFISQASPRNTGYMGGYVAPPGLDLTPVVLRKNAVLLAWADDYSPTERMFHYSPRRSHRSTFWRCAVPLPAAPP